MDADLEIMSKNIEQFGRALGSRDEIGKDNHQTFADCLALLENTLKTVIGPEMEKASQAPDIPKMIKGADIDRAGKHGKGFAVVAQDVRNLAGRSAKAAQETAELIERSTHNVDKGLEIVHHTAQSFREIVDAIAKVSDLMDEITSAGNEQALGIGQINQGLSQIEQVTHQNTANAEQTASAAEELSDQAGQLRRLLSHFKLKKESRISADSPEEMQALPEPDDVWENIS